MINKGKVIVFIHVNLTIIILFVVSIAFCIYYQYSFYKFTANNNYLSLLNSISLSLCSGIIIYLITSIDSFNEMYTRLSDFNFQNKLKVSYTNMYIINKIIDKYDGCNFKNDIKEIYIIKCINNKMLPEEKYKDTINNIIQYYLKEIINITTEILNSNNKHFIKIIQTYQDFYPWIYHLTPKFNLFKKAYLLRHSINRDISYYYNYIKKYIIDDYNLYCIIYEKYRKKQL